MPRLHRFLILTLLLTIATSPTATADTCSWECLWWTYEGCGEEVYVCSPEYYTWQTATEPDWCLYEVGDRVDVLRDSQFNIVAWYVEPWDDPEANGSYYVVHNSGGCSIIVLP